MLLWLAVTGAAVAQSGVQGFEPAQIERQIERPPAPVSRPALPRLPGPAESRVDLDVPSFTLAGVLIEGASVYSNLEFLPLYQPFLGRSMTVADLHELADAITRRYREDDYFLSSALVPAQTVEFGVVRIRIVEGHVERFRIDDGEGRADPVIERMLRPVLEQRPVRRTDLVDALRTINGLPGITVTPELRAIAGQPGAYLLALGTDRRRYDASLSVDNRGSEFIGPVRAIASLAVHGLAGRHESWQLQLATASDTDELRYVDVANEWPLGARGLRLRLAATDVASRPGDALRDIEAEIANRRYRLGLSWPLTRETDTRRDISLDIDNYRSLTDVAGVRLLDDRLNSVQLGYRQVHAEGGGRLLTLTLSLSQGLATGGSRQVDVRQPDSAGEPDFTVLLASYGIRQVFSNGWEADVLIEGQAARDALPSSQRYSIGGTRFGRAYDPSEISGDHGLAGRVEIARRDLRPARSWRLRSFVFHDVGAVWRIDDSATQRRVSAASLGIGVQASGPGVSGSLELARPLTREVASRESRQARVFGNIVFRF